MGFYPKEICMFKGTLRGGQGHRGQATAGTSGDPGAWQAMGVSGAAPYEILIPTGGQTMAWAVAQGPEFCNQWLSSLQWGELPLGWELAVAVVSAVRADRAGWGVPPSLKDLSYTETTELQVCTDTIHSFSY